MKINQLITYPDELEKVHWAAGMAMVYIAEKVYRKMSFLSANMVIAINVRIAIWALRQLKEQWGMDCSDVFIKVLKGEWTEELKQVGLCSSVYSDYCVHFGMVVF